MIHFCLIRDILYLLQWFKSLLTTSSANYLPAWHLCQVQWRSNIFCPWGLKFFCGPPFPNYVISLFYVFGSAHSCSCFWDSELLSQKILVIGSANGENIVSFWGHSFVYFQCSLMLCHCPALAFCAFWYFISNSSL